MVARGAFQCTVKEFVVISEKSIPVGESRAIVQEKYDTFFYIKNTNYTISKFKYLNSTLKKTDYFIDIFLCIIRTYVT